MKKLISAALIAVLALSNVAFAKCAVNGKAVDAADKAACDAQAGTWTEDAAAPAAPAAGSTQATN